MTPVQKCVGPALTERPVIIFGDGVAILVQSHHPGDGDCVEIRVQSDFPKQSKTAGDERQNQTKPSTPFREPLPLHHNEVRHIKDIDFITGE